MPGPKRKYTDEERKGRARQRYQEVACHELWYWRLPERKREALPPLVAGRIHGRPYCRPCLATRPPRGKAERGENPNPWTENAVRTMEDGR